MTEYQLQWGRKPNRHLAFAWGNTRGQAVDNYRATSGETATIVDVIATKGTLHAAKARATRAEKRRVYDNMNLPPQDIRAQDPLTRQWWVRRAWQGVNEFGWKGWERE